MQVNHYYVFAESSHHQSRRNGIAAMGHGFLIQGFGFGLDRHWGFGAERDTQAFWAHGLERAATAVFLECPEPTITVVKASPGEDKFLTEFIPEWLRKLEHGGLTSKHSLEIWKRVYELSRLSRFRMRKPESRDERKLTQEIKAAAAKAAGDAVRHRDVHPALYLELGVFVTDETQKLKSDGGR